MTIIAEIGQNHCGDMVLAKQLIEYAKENGADLVKFQLYDHKALYGDNSQIPNVELSFEQAKMLFDYGDEIGIEVFFSVFDVERVKWCEQIGVKRYKLASYMSADEKITKILVKIGKPIIVSVTEECGIPLRLCKFRGKSLLYCVPNYPTDLSDIHFCANFNIYYQGFSDHSIGLDAAKIALARGVTIIEKHFAIDHRTGVDSAWSMTPSELKELKRFENVAREIM